MIADVRCLSRLSHSATVTLTVLPLAWKAIRCTIIRLTSPSYRLTAARAGDAAAGDTLGSIPALLCAVLRFESLQPANEGAPMRVTLSWDAAA